MRLALADSGCLFDGVGALGHAQCAFFYVGLFDCLCVLRCRWVVWVVSGWWWFVVFVFAVGEFVFGGPYVWGSWEWLVDSKWYSVMECGWVRVVWVVCHHGQCCDEV